MKRRSDLPDTWENLRERIIGLGERSIQKSYYPELQKKLGDLQLFRALLGQSNDAIFLIKIPEYTLIDVNESTCSQLGFPRQELLSMTFPDIILEPGPEALRGLLEEQDAAKQGLRITAELRRKTGGTVPFEMNIRRVDQADSSYVVAVARDITERRRSEEELNRYREHLEEIVRERTYAIQDRNERLAEEIEVRTKTEQALKESIAETKDLYDNAPCGYHSLDEDGVFIRINETELKWLGYSRKELLGKMSFPDILTEESRQLFSKNFPRFKKQGFIRDLEFNLIRKDGTVLPVVLSATAVRDKNGNFVMSRSTLFDVTDMKNAEKDRLRLENRLLQSQKIEALGSFAGGIAHDLNNVLYPVILNIEMLLEETDQGTEIHETLDQTLKAMYRQRDLVKQILSFSRQGIQKLSAIHVAPLLENTLGFLRSSLPSTIEIERSIDASYDSVMADPAQIQQVIMNLCKNAADSLELQKGIIEVSLSHTRLNPNPAMPEVKPGHYLELKVSDSGKGISPDNLTRIFDPFFTTKGVGKGTGMGLAVVHGILRKHGGMITVESREGKGSTFTAYLPLYQEKKEEVMPSKQEEEAREKILLVDDEEIILSSLKRALERLGYEVITAKDSMAALDMFRKSPDMFGLVITDLTMPKLTGIDLGKKLMEIQPDIPVILCTGFSDTVNEEEAKELGFSGLIMKPAGTSELRAAVHQALEG